MLSLIAGIWTGLSRLGWGIPEIRVGLLEFHGPLMICGFLGTVIGLERAVALDKGWAYLGPFLSGIGSIMIIFSQNDFPGQLLITIASLLFVIVFIAILRKQLATFTVTMGLGALLWLIGNVLWLSGYPVYLIVSWWAGYLVLTIGGERLDLSRFLSPSRSSYVIFFASIFFFLIGVIYTTTNSVTGIRIFGLGMIALTVWLVMHDIATKTIKQVGLTRFVAVCLLTGYFWLGLSGIFALFSGELTPGTAMYDAILHSLFLGFVLAMIFGHAPIIFPAVLGVPIIYSPLFYIHFALLQASLIIRIAGDIASISNASMGGGLLNAVSLLLFIVNTAVGGIRGVMSQRA
jgi:hypothetical protein